jgi:PBP1b-binding outer membrane lipoprotein LpoB
MKKLLLLIAATSMILAACSEDKKETTEKTTTDTPKTEEKADSKIDLMKFYLSISKSINETDADLNAFESAETLPEGAELQTMKDAAKTSADETIAQIQALEIPGTLVDKQEKIESALTKIEESYTMKSEALTAEGEVVFDQATVKFEEADAELNVLLEEVELAPSSILTEVSN